MSGLAVDRRAPYREANLRAPRIAPIGSVMELQVSALGFLDKRARGVPFMVGAKDVSRSAAIISFPKVRPRDRRRIACGKCFLQGFVEKFFLTLAAPLIVGLIPLSLSVMLLAHLASDHSRGKA